MLSGAAPEQSRAQPLWSAGGARWPEESFLSSPSQAAPLLGPLWLVRRLAGLIVSKGGCCFAHSVLLELALDGVQVHSCPGQSNGSAV